MIRQHPLHILSGVQRGQLWRAELFQGHHAAETADGIIMEGIFEDLPHLFKQRVGGDLRKCRDVLRRILHMNVDLIGIRLILRRRGCYDGVKNGLLAWKVIVQRRRLDANRLCDLAHADGIIVLRGKQLQRLIQNLLLCIFLFHHHASLTNIS